MFRYLVSDDDGRITQRNRVYDPNGYPDVLFDNNVPFTHIVGTDIGIPHQDRSWIDPDNRERVLSRQISRAYIMRNRIKAGGSEVVIIRDLPRRFKITVLRNGIIIPGCLDYPMELDADCVMEWGADEPGSFDLQFNAFPIQDFAFKIEAYA